MRVAFIAAECEPWAKTGGLGDVVDALARALGRLQAGPEAPVDVFLPRYRSDDPARRRARRASGSGSPTRCRPTGPPRSRSSTSSADGYRLRLVDHPPAFDRAGYYGEPGGGDYPDNAWRFGLFCRAALETLRTDGRPVDVLHLHDWHAGAGGHPARPVATPTTRSSAARRALMTIHNLAYHGWVPRDRAPPARPRAGRSASSRRTPSGSTCSARGDRAVRARQHGQPRLSPREALTPEYGMGLDDARPRRAANSRATAFLRDPQRPRHGRCGTRRPTTDLAAPLLGRADLARQGRLPGRPADPARVRSRRTTAPVIGMIGRLDPQKGFDLLADAAPRLARARRPDHRPGQRRRPRSADPFRALAAARPARVALVERFDRAIARRIYAGADLFLMPSRFEPCGQGQMIALRYGTPPVVRRTGGLGDTVIDETEHAGLRHRLRVRRRRPRRRSSAACRRALRSVAGTARPPPGTALVERGMALDFSWEPGSAPRYAVAYRQAAELRRTIVAAG